MTSPSIISGGALEHYWKCFRDPNLPRFQVDRDYTMTFSKYHYP